MVRAHRTLKLRLLGIAACVLAVACGGGDPGGGSNEAIVPSAGRPAGDPEIDLASRLNVPEGGAVPAGTTLKTTIGLPLEATLVVRGAGSFEVALEEAGERVLTETIQLDGGPAELELGDGGRRRVALSLTANADARIDAVHARVPNRPPDIILIVIDTLRADVFINRRDLVSTPRINELLMEGVPFRDAFAHAPMTLPAHVALFSSRPPFENGVLNNGQTVPEDLPLFAEHLQEQGYQTHAVVSLGTLWPNAQPDTTLDRGFDTYVHTPGHVTAAPVVSEAISKALDDIDPVQPLFFFAHYCDPHEPYNVHGLRQDGLDPFVADIRVDGKKIETVGTSDMTYWVREFRFGPGEHRFEVTSDRNVNIRVFNAKLDGRPVPVRLLNGKTGEELERFRGKALRHAIAEFSNKSDGAQTFEIEAWLTDHPMGKTVPYRYFREVDYVDGYIGGLVDQLKRRGLYDQAAVVFTSDHGEALREHNYTGHVESLFDEMIHVPLLVKPPVWFLPEQRETLGTYSRRVVRHADVVPTLLDMGGLDPLPGQRGLSLLAQGPRPVISETHTPEASESQIALRDDTHKLIYYIDRDEFQLYEFAEDPGELNDVFAQQGGDFEDWQVNLKQMAKLAARSGIDLDSLNSEDRARLEGIGYFGE